MCPENRFDIIFDERVDGPLLLAKMNKIDKKELEEDEDVHEERVGCGGRKVA